MSTASRDCGSTTSTISPATRPIPRQARSCFSDVDARWRRKEVNFYGKTPWGLDFNIGYDYTKFNHTKAGWIDNFVRYTSATAGEFRIGQFKTPVGWEEASSSAATVFLERALPVQAANMGRRIGADWLYKGIPNFLVDLFYFDGGDLNGDNKGHGPPAHIVWNPFNYQPGAGSRRGAEYPPPRLCDLRRKAATRSATI